MARNDSDSFKCDFHYLDPATVGPSRQKERSATQMERSTRVTLSMVVLTAVGFALLKAKEPTRATG